MAFLPSVQWIKPQLTPAILRGLTSITGQKVGLGSLTLQYRGPRQDFTADIQKIYGDSQLVAWGSGSTRGVNLSLPNLTSLSAIHSALQRTGVSNPAQVLKHLVNGQAEAPVIATHKGRTRIVSGEPYLLMASFFGITPNVVHLNLDSKG